MGTSKAHVASLASGYDHHRLMRATDQVIGVLLRWLSVRYLVRKAGPFWVQRGDAVGFLRPHRRDPLGACHHPHPTWMPCHLTA